MKVILDNLDDSVIAVSKCTEELYYVATEKSEPVGFLTKREFDNEGGFWVRYFDGLTAGNGYSTESETIEIAIRHWCGSFQTREVHAFKTKDEAFKFISQNL